MEAQKYMNREISVFLILFKFFSTRTPRVVKSGNETTLVLMNYSEPSPNSVHSTDVMFNLEM